MNAVRRLTCLCAVVLGRLAAATADTPAIQWQPWETLFTSSHPSEGLYRTVEVNVHCEGPNGAAFDVPAYWDGGQTFRAAIAFPAPGEWHWQTSSNDATKEGLHHRSGVVKVAAYQGANPLYRHGDLRVSQNRRYLIHADGTPFLWLGDTGWNAAWGSTMAEWREYVDARAKQGFSVLQVVETGVAGKKAPPPGPNPFLPGGEPDPAVWSVLAQKIAYANERGLVVAIMGVGKSYVGYTEQQRTPAFTRFVAGRFAGLMVVFSPSMDQKFDAANDDAGARLHALTRHLVTQHPATDLPTIRQYHDAAYTDFAGLQSGHHEGKLAGAYRAARIWTLELWQREPIKPVINIEAMYDAHGDDSGPNWREQDARKLGWFTWLSGARGYTYGAGDVPPKVKAGAGGMWRFNGNPDAYDYWRKVLEWPSARQMTHLRDLLATLPWWRLEPAPDIVHGAPADELRVPVASCTPEGDLVVAYLPDNADVVLDLRRTSGELSGRWYDPRHGVYLPCAQAITRDAAQTFRRPENWADAVLVLERTAK